MMILESLDGHNDDLIINITVERNGEVIDMCTEEAVSPNSLWRASIQAYGCESDMVVTDDELSKLERISVQQYMMLSISICQKVPMIFRMLL